MVDFQELKPPRAALYVDGFNLYHALHEHADKHNENFIKWLNLWKLGELLCQAKSYQLVKVVFCTAVPEELGGTRDRHITYNNALKAVGVVVVPGHHVTDPESGKRNEKQSDINLALTLICDATDDVFDVAYILTADSDQAATGKFFTERHPNKTLFSVAPLKRKPPEKLRQYARNSLALTLEQIEKALFPAIVIGKAGGIRRPQAYQPPEWWVHPDERPKRTKTRANYDTIF